jgi:hypothetical protein
MQLEIYNLFRWTMFHFFNIKVGSGLKIVRSRDKDDI